MLAPVRINNLSSRKTGSIIYVESSGNDENPIKTGAAFSVTMGPTSPVVMGLYYRSKLGYFPINRK
jgi:hypothetical protein